MLTGTADLSLLAAGAAVIPAFSSEPVHLEEVSCLQVIAEMRRQAREAILPCSLHPTIPPALSLQFWQVGASQVGPFAFAMARASCRSGIRARGFTLASYTDTAAAQGLLAARYGFQAKLANIQLETRYDGSSASLSLHAQSILHLEALNPEPLAPGDVQYTGTMNLAETPKGLRLVQVEAQYATTRAERLTGRLDKFAAAAWGSQLLDPYHVVSTSLTWGNITLAPVRFVSRVDELAFTGTESV